MTSVGYCRVSTDEQVTALQSDAMDRAGIDVLFREEASAGAAASRPVLAAALAACQAGDTLVVWRLDRLGRSLADLIAIATELRDRGVFLRSLTEGFDTSTASGRLLYHVLGAVAEFERETIRERTVAGMRSAQKRGTHVGRPIALGGSRLEHARELLANGKTKTAVARILRVSRATIQRALRAG
jgi:DNA invertase Pin-like site-specific DNA recombinase